MDLFLQLESGYIGIAIFALLVTIFISTRPFITKSGAKKIIFTVVISSFSFILAHYFTTTSRMDKTENSFLNNEKIICESRMLRKVSQSIIIQKSNDWKLTNHIFTSPNYTRGFFSARCLTYKKVTLDLKK